MALTLSNMVALGTSAPDFTLLDTVSGDKMSLMDLKYEKGVLVMFICNHCPYVKHVNEEIVRLANDYQQKGIAFIAISSNDIESHPEDSPDLMKSNAENLKFTFPYLYDETQEVAKSYDAACTPDFYLFDHKLKLIYRGQLDSSRPGNNIPLNGSDLRNAMENLLKGNHLSDQQIPSMGCNIKWKS